MLNPSSSPKWTYWTVQLPVYLFIYLTCSQASAQVYNSSVSAATGGSGRAAVESGDSIYLNPATLPHLRGRHFLASFAKDQMDLSFSDNTDESAFPGAIAYLQDKTSITQDGVVKDVKNQDFDVTLADFVKGPVTVGISGHYFQSKIQNDSKMYHQINGDLGLAYVMTKTIGFGAVVYNFAGARPPIPDAFRLEPSAALGFNYIFHQFVRMRLDVLTGPQYNFAKGGVDAGLESFLSEFLVWRVGYQNDNNLDRNLMTAGLGFAGPKFSINYAYQGNTKESSDYRHSIDLQIPF